MLLLMILQFIFLPLMFLSVGYPSSYWIGEIADQGRVYSEWTWIYCRTAPAGNGIWQYRSHSWPLSWLFGSCASIFISRCVLLNRVSQIRTNKVTIISSIAMSDGGKSRVPRGGGLMAGWLVSCPKLLRFEHCLTNFFYLRDFPFVCLTAGYVSYFEKEYIKYNEHGGVMKSVRLTFQFGHCILPQVQSFYPLWFIARSMFPSPPTTPLLSLVPLPFSRLTMNLFYHGLCNSEAKLLYLYPVTLLTLPIPQPSQKPTNGTR